MTSYIGFDAHIQTCTLLRVSERRKRSAAVVVRTVAKDIIDAVRAFPPPRVLCLEEGTMSEWLCEMLHPHVDTLYVVQPEKRQGNKSDQKDACALAETARLGPKTCVYKPYGQLVELRAAARNYDECQRDLARAKNRFLAAFRMRGIRLEKDYSDVDSRDELLALLKAPYDGHARALGARLDAAFAAREEAQQWLENAASKVSAVKLLCSLPGIATIRAAQIVAVVVTPERFPNRSKFWSYCGLGIASFTSADWQVDNRGNIVPSKHRNYVHGLNRNRNPILKNVYFGAATTVAGLANQPLADHYRALIKGGMPEHKAKATLARRIASASLAIWKSKEEYDPAKHIERTKTD